MAKSIWSWSSSIGKSLLAAVFIAALFAVSPISMARAQENSEQSFIDKPDYNLIKEADDSPQEATLKAALRLLSAYTQVQTICNQCGDQKVFQKYAQVNGSTLALVIKAIQTYAGQDSKWKAAVDDDSKAKSAQQLKIADCATLLGHIRKGEWSLYTGRFTEDYKLIKGH
jgi:hypothetical protein